MRTSSLVLLLLAVSSPAAADTYKYKRADGTVIYTDDLGQLPPERRAYYNQQKAERESKRRELESRIGKEELERREMEQKKAELQRAQMEEAQRRERMSKIDEQIRQINERRRAQEADRGKWQARIKAARAKLAQLLADFAKARETYEGIAVRAAHTLLPGQSEEAATAKATMDRLEGEIDAQVIEVEETIPEEARRAGVPPGWLRD